MMGIRRTRGMRRGSIVGLGVSALAMVAGAMALHGPRPADPGNGQRVSEASAGPSRATRGAEALGSVATTPAQSPATTSTPPATTRRPSTPTSVGKANTGRGSLLMWPFTTEREVVRWETSYSEGGHQPWHTSPCDTAGSFVRFVLGYSDVTEVARCEIRGDQAFVTVGHPGEGRVIPAGATVHLVRVGSNPGGWVVVGSRDRTTLRIISPRYGAAVTRLIHLVGKVSGLGEDMLRVRILDRAGRTLGEAPPRLIGPGGSWTADIRVPVSTDRVLIAVASTDSGLGSLGDLALTALVPNG